MKNAAAKNKKVPVKTTSEVIEPNRSALAHGSEIDELISVIEQQNQVIEKKSSVIDAQKKRIEILEQYLRLERARRFGPSSEQSPAQTTLFNEAEQLDDLADESEQEPQSSQQPKRKKGRKGLSKDLPRHQIHLNLSEEEKAGAVDTFYTVVKEELDIVPAKARVIEYLQEKTVLGVGCFISTQVLAYHSKFSVIVPKKLCSSLTELRCRKRLIE